MNLEEFLGSLWSKIPICYYSCVKKNRSGIRVERQLHNGWKKRYEQEKTGREGRANETATQSRASSEKAKNGRRRYCSGKKSGHRCGYMQISKKEIGS
jgi:hypothetical protein